MSGRRNLVADLPTPALRIFDTAAARALFGAAKEQHDLHGSHPFGANQSKMVHCPCQIHMDPNSRACGSSTNHYLGGCFGSNVGMYQSSQGTAGTNRAKRILNSLVHFWRPRWALKGVAPKPTMAPTTTPKPPRLAQPPRTSLCLARPITTPVRAFPRRHHGAPNFAFSCHAAGEAWRRQGLGCQSVHTHQLSCRRSTFFRPWPTP